MSIKDGNRGDDDPAHKEWAKIVKERDSFRCDICGAVGVPLESHHLNSYYYFPEQRYDIDNGVCLCRKHHEHFHLVYSSNCHKWQYEQFKKTCKAIQRIVNIKK